MTLAQKRLVFITGVEGSGTTMMAQWLAGPSFAAGLTKRAPSPAYVRAADEVNLLTERLWNQHSRPSEQERKTLIDQIRNIPIDDAVTHVVWKRSTPFRSPEFMPLLGDIRAFASHCNLLVMKRAPVACAASILRRGMVGSTSEACTRIKAAAAHLTEQLRELESLPQLVVSYEDVIASPASWAEPFERWLEYPAGSLRQLSDIVGQPTIEAQEVRQHQGPELSAALADLQYGY